MNRIRLCISSLVLINGNSTSQSRTESNKFSFERKQSAVNLLGALLALCAAPAFATDAGQLLQQIEKERPTSLPDKSTTVIAPVPEPMRAVEDVMITVTKFQFVGSTLLNNEQLAAVVAGYLNRPLGFAELQGVATAVANTYRVAGWIVRAYLPQQDIKEGIVTIQIVEAVFGGTHIKGDIPRRISQQQILRLFDTQQKTGELLNADQIDRAILLADDLPGVSVSGSLREGTKDRETNVDLKLGEESLVAGSVSLDNSGSRATGVNHLSANLSINSPFKHGDLVSANVSHTQGSDYLRLGGTLPLGSNGLRTGVSASHMNYKLVTADFVALGSKGTSDTVGLEATYPLIRSRLKNLYLNLNADHKLYYNQSAGATTTNYSAKSLSISLYGNLFDNLGGGGTNSASLSLVDGIINLDGSPNKTPDATSTNTAGHYTKLHLAVSRQQVISETFSLYGALSAQAASKNLDSSEKFYLGGLTGVRAYPSIEGGGSEGTQLNLEMRWRLPQGYNFTGFFDYGHVTVNTNNNFKGASALNDYSLRGAGMALAWQSAKGLGVKAIYARRIGKNPNAITTKTNFGYDQDGTLVKNRFWLNASIPF